MSDYHIVIIIPVYNAENYLEHCLNSILSQTYQDWEAICINDGSTDNSATILNNYSKKDSRIRVIHQDNKGASSARNKGLELVNYSPNTWISFIDSDDYIAPNMYYDIISTLLKINDNECDYVRLSCRHVTSREHIIPDDTTDFKLLTKEEYFINGEVGGLVACLFIKSTIVFSNKILFPTDMTILEDQVFSLKCALASRKILVYKKRNYFYVDNEFGVSKNNKSRSGDIVKCINYVYDAMSQCQEKGIQKYLHNVYLPIKIDSYISDLLRFGKGEEILKINIKRYIRSFKTYLKYCFIKITNRI